MGTVISGGKVVFEGGVTAATILIGDDGAIEAILRPGDIPSADEVIDASGLHVFPGAVDPHTHLNDPGVTESEDFYSGTCGAAAGGVTTVLEMPLTVPLVASQQRFLEKLSIARSKAVVDFCLWGALTPENTEEGCSEISDMAEAGAVAFKAFTAEATQIPRIPDRLLARAMKQVTDLGLLVGVHCEDQPLIDYYTEKLMQEGRNDPLVNPDSRPPIAEIEAARRVIMLGELAGARFHLVHISCPATFDLVSEAKARGTDVTAETCAHYLKLTRDDVKRIGSYAMCNPPLRGRTELVGLWTRLSRGYIDCIGTDHCAYTEAAKANPNFWDMPAGINGMQVMLPLVAGEAAAHGVDLPTVARVFSEGPARRFGLYPKKGAIRPGSDADLVLLDLEAPWMVRGALLFSKAPGTAYEGYEVPARIRRTLVRGRTVFLDGEGPSGRILAEPGFGQFLSPAGVQAAQSK